MQVELKGKEREEERERENILSTALNRLAEATGDLIMR